MTCPDDPAILLRDPVCLTTLSKDLKGELALHASEPYFCKEPGCKTLKTAHELKVEVLPHAPCDSPESKVLNGILEVGRLITAFEQDGTHRGLHAGDFVWTGAGTKVTGRISGMTNVGTQRQPAFDKCQVCDTRGVMEGRLCGEIVEAHDPALKGCEVFGAYRIHFEPSAKGGNGGVAGTFEGVIVCPCKP